MVNQPKPQGTASAPSTTTYTYYHQFAITPYYTVDGAGSPSATGAVHYTSNGASQSSAPTQGASGGTPIWADINTAITYTSPIAGATGERWQWLLAIQDSAKF